jgi:hypothetical protein
MIVARHEVPGKRPPKEPSCRVRYDRALLIQEVFLVESAVRIDVRAAVRCDGPFPEHIDFFCFRIRNFVIAILQSPNRSAHTRQNQTVPYGTALLGCRFPGTLCQATIALSLRDKGHSPMGSLIKLALMRVQTLGFPGLRPWAESYSPSGATNRANHTALFHMLLIRR